MIRIVKFPSVGKSLCEVLEILRLQLFELTIEWRYTSEEELNVLIQSNRADVESLIASWLSVHRFLYGMESRSGGSDSQEEEVQYCIWKPEPGSTSIFPLWKENVLQIFLIGLKKSSGSVFSIRLQNDGVRLRVAASFRGRVVPQELNYALGRGYRLMPAGYLPYFFDYSKERDEALLSLPYCMSAGSVALVQGFGSAAQAVADLDVCTQVIGIGPVFNDPLHHLLCLTKDNLRSSTYVFGAPGYGKTTFLQSILYQVWTKWHLPFLVIEPKREYRTLKALIPELTVLPSVQGFNPLIPPRGVSVYDYVEVVIELLELAESLPADSPLPGYIRETYYRIMGQKDYTMGHFLETYLKVMGEKKFNGLATNFVISGLNRLENLFRIFAGPNFRQATVPAFDISRYLQCPTVVEIGKVATPRMVTVLTYFVTMHLKMYLDAARESGRDITNILCLEEAHTLLSPHMSENLRFSLGNLLAEGRAKGLTVIVCDQTPSRLDETVCNLCGNAVTFRLMALSDRNFARSQLECEPEEINDLRKYCAMVRLNGMYKCATVRVEVPEAILR